MENSEKVEEEGKELRTAHIAHRTTPAIKKMLVDMAKQNYRSPARENERLIIEAFEKL